MDALHTLMKISRTKDMSGIMRLHMLKTLMLNLDENNPDDREALPFIRQALLETRTAVKQSGVRYAN